MAACIIAILIGFLLLIAGGMFIGSLFRHSGCIGLMLALLWAIVVSAVMLFIIFKIL